MNPTLDIGQFDNKVLVFGGPYSNLHATQALLEEAKALGIGPSNIICTGDIVAYCAQPEETSQLIKDSGIVCVQGNCEESLALGAPDCGCGFAEGSACDLLSSQWYNYSKSRVSDGLKTWMGQLPGQVNFSLGGISFAVVHGAVGDINRFVFASEPEQFLTSQLALAGRKVVVGGHSGIPFGRKLGEGAWLNAGVIGMPANDGNPSTWYMVLEAVKEGVRVTWHSLQYDFEAANRQMFGHGLNNGYAQGLVSGLWPSMDVLPETERQKQGQALEQASLILESS